MIDTDNQALNRMNKLILQRFRTFPGAQIFYNWPINQAAYIIKYKNYSFHIFLIIHDFSRPCFTEKSLNHLNKTKIFWLKVHGAREWNCASDGISESDFNSIGFRTPPLTFINNKNWVQNIKSPFESNIISQSTLRLRFKRIVKYSIVNTK